MDNKQTKEIKHRQFSGTVVSTKMDKTAVVRVDNTKIVPKYKKRIIVSKKFKVDDPTGICKVGEVVVFEECRPLSKDKRWRVVIKGQSK